MYFEGKSVFIVFSLSVPPVAHNGPSYTDGDVARKMGINVSPQYKGFYRYGK